MGGGFGPLFRIIMATFRCLQSGTTVTFTQQVDIDSMRGHQGYVRLDEQVEPEIKPLPVPVKKMGRPRKLTVKG
jgi:hypothetical protein